MVKFFVSSEGDIESGVKYASTLAKEGDWDKFITVGFDNTFMMEVFLDSLIEEFLVEGITIDDHNIDITLTVYGGD